MKEADIKKLGKYDILGELGKGAMGVVYKGQDPFIERFVALKTVRTDLLVAEDPEATTAQITRFKREAQAAGRINHPNIVAIYEYGEDGPTAFIAMEFIAGRDLKDYFDKSERFDLKTIVRIMSEVLSALDYAHKHGIVHRDIKPANIMITSAGEVKITDFGIARLESSNLTQAGTVMGTPSYMSPEQFMGQQVDARSDLFSAGAVLYQMLTGEKPFTGSLTTIMHRVLHAQPEPPSVLNVQIPSDFDQVVARAMAKRPDDRYQNAAEFAQAIRDAAERKLTAAAAQPSASSPAPASAQQEIDSEATLSERTMFAAEATVLPKAAPAAPSAPPPSPPPSPPPAPAPSPAREEELSPRDLMSDAAPLRAARPASAPPPAEGEGGGKGKLIGIAAAVMVVAGGVAGWLMMGRAPAPLEPAARPPQIAEPARPQQAAEEARRQAEEQARRQQAADEARRQAEEQARQQQTAAEARRQAEEQARQQQAAAENARRQAEEQARQQQAAAENARRQAEEQARQQQAAAENARRQAEEQARQQQAALQAQQAALGQVRTALARVNCALLKAENRAEGGVQVSGIAGETIAESQLRAVIEAAAPGIPYGLSFDSMTRPMCEPLAAFSRPRERNQEQARPVAVQPSSPGAVYRNGQDLVLEIDGPGFASYLQVDYFTLEGDVVHLLPNGIEKDHRLAAGGHRRLGDRASGGRFWTVGQPFGREMIVVTASVKPLFATPRPEAEPAAAYLGELRKALESAAKGTNPPVAATMVITTVPN